VPPGPHLTPLLSDLVLLRHVAAHFWFNLGQPSQTNEVLPEIMGQPWTSASAPAPGCALATDWVSRPGAYGGRHIFSSKDLNGDGLDDIITCEEWGLPDSTGQITQDTCYPGYYGSKGGLGKTMHKTHLFASMMHAPLSSVSDHVDVTEMKCDPVKNTCAANRECPMPTGRTVEYIRNANKTWTRKPGYGECFDICNLDTVANKKDDNVYHKGTFCGNWIDADRDGYQDFIVGAWGPGNLQWHSGKFSEPDVGPRIFLAKGVPSSPPSLSLEVSPAMDPPNPTLTITLAFASRCQTLRESDSSGKTCRSGTRG
jgi:hypothetical protein